MIPYELNLPLSNFEVGHMLCFFSFPRDDFTRYANTCFNAFGDRVKKWITFDEPNDYAGLGYATNQNPPGRCTSGIELYGLCFEGDSGTEPYIVGHNLLLAHAEAAYIYRTIYQVSQKCLYQLSIVKITLMELFVC